MEAKFYRAADIHRPAGQLPISKSYWFQLVKRGIAPQPVKVGRVSMWRAADVDAFVAKLAADDTAVQEVA